ncbi:glutathione S-transferase family protein [Pelomicrobium methylotrophicum]|uniref:Glutathione S-transferase n=1 Tax=Pelomicrobium methylotrophicum TaxID=2602750 RepID=A0A5C7EIX5_9PROT|nr:glutathione S-transferase [Pelomicrobium methylotrophicum]TXF11325.1 glutathione S-transferase [Pelomicrobium methylotrophicum]
MLKIWGRANSINVQKVLWCAEELGLPYQRIDAGMEYGVVNTAEYRKLNPNGLVPTLEDGNLVLWESNAIVRYLAARYGAGSLWPTDPAVRADSDKWMDWQVSTLWTRLRPVFWGLIRTPPEKRNAQEIETAYQKTREAFAILDQALAGRQYVAGDAFTMGDIALGVAAQRWFNLPVERPAAPNLEAWYQRLRERPAFSKIVDHPLT